jgi:transcription elongation factor Elf1
MSLFDEVLLPCPKCGKNNYAQSKGGWCRTIQYDFDTAPDPVLADMVDEELTCSQCGTKFAVKAKFCIEEIL